MSPFVRRPLLRLPDRLRARSVLWLLLAVYTATFVGIADNPDGEISYQTTRSLARSASLALGDTPEARLIVEHARASPPGASSVRADASGERFYAWFGVGQALVGVPFYWVGQLLGRLPFGELEARHDELGQWGLARTEYLEHLVVGWRNPLLGALTAWLLVLTARRLGAKRRDAWLAGVTYGLTSYAWPQARSSLSDVQACFLLFLAFHAILRLRERYERGMRARPWELAGIGCSLGLAVLTRVAVSGAALLLLLLCAVVVTLGCRRSAALVWTPPGKREHVLLRAAFWLCLPVVLALALFLWTNQLRFGSPLDSGYAPALSAMGLGQRPPWAGLPGLLVSPGRGLLWYAPPLLLVPFGCLRAWRQGERLWPWTTALLVPAVLLPASWIPGWHGAWTYGPRYILPILPFLWIGVALALTEARGQRPLGWCAAALFLWGGLVQVPGALVDTMSYHELAVRAARLEWPETESAGDPDSERFERMQWSWGFAPPWVHWRILRHRVAGLPEELPAAEIFLVDGADSLRPSFARDEGFRHLAWVDWHERLGGSLLLPFGLIALFLAAAVLEGLR